MDIFPTPYSWGNDKNPSMFLLIPINFDVLVFVQEMNYMVIIVLIYIFPICVYGNFRFRMFCIKALF